MVTIQVALYVELLSKGINNIVFLGNSGSGKSEMAINFALEIRKLTDKDVHLFDMDQTKPLFRSRDLIELVESNNIKMHSGKGLLDSPIVPSGVEESSSNKNEISIYDVGGNDIGAFTMGQYSDFFNTDDTQVFYVYNYYRPFSDNDRHVEKNLFSILNASRIKEIGIIGNPNYGVTTDESVFEHGVEETKKIVAKLEYEISAFTVRNELYSELMIKECLPIIPIKLYIKGLMPK